MFPTQNVWNQSFDAYDAYFLKTNSGDKRAEDYAVKMAEQNIPKLEIQSRAFTQHAQRVAEQNACKAATPLFHAKCQRHSMSDHTRYPDLLKNGSEKNGESPRSDDPWNSRSAAVNGRECWWPCRDRDE